MEKILIKYDYTGESVKINHNTMVKFNYDKCIDIPYNGNTADMNIRILKQLHDQVISMEYLGLSRVDEMKLFSIDIKKVLRNKKLNDIIHYILCYHNIHKYNETTTYWYPPPKIL